MVEPMLGKDIYSSAPMNMDIPFDPERFFFLLTTNRQYLYQCYFSISQTPAGYGWGSLKMSITSPRPLTLLLTDWLYIWGSHQNNSQSSGKHFTCYMKEMHRAKYGRRTMGLPSFLQVCHISTVGCIHQPRSFLHFIVQEFLQHSIYSPFPPLPGRCS